MTSSAASAHIDDHPDHPLDATERRALRDEALELLRKLVRNACVNDLTPDSGQEERNADTLEEYFAGAPVSIRRLEPRPGRTSIIVTVEGEDPEAEPLTFLGHTDVVPVDEPRWTTEPFGAEVIDGKIYGRGTQDMLGITASMAVVTRRIAESPRRPKGTLTFVGVADEEARGGLGAKWLSEEHPGEFSWRNAVGERGGAHIRPADGTDHVTVTIGEKGAAQRRLHVTGDAGHGSQPYGVTSSIRRIGVVAQRISDATPPVSQDGVWENFVRVFDFDGATLAALAEGSPNAYEAFGDLAGYAYAISHLTVSPTVVRAGEAINVFPSSAHLDLDIRTLPGQTDDDVDAYLRGVLGDIAEEVRIERLISEPASLSPTGTPVFEAITETIAEFFPESTVLPIISGGGTDLRFARRLGGVGYGFALNHRDRTFAHESLRGHGHDEHLHLEDLELTVAAYLRLTERVLLSGRTRRGF
ncbi:M20/M25/M40 family metallo-hydrolase [Corynebacterium pacaense]|uniref:M20/M25/M40 family metallo-hydrolase n=1 Tax=Corynebacterium pacaense TaxID=1816684 RepID=UPI0009BC36C3|nr:M20/M25/M40 family metallo-hydrolase [Corynebacterium pacaense]